MSKIGKKAIKIPKSVDLKIDGSLISTKGPKGELNITLEECISALVKEDNLFLSLKKDNQEKKELWGLTRALVSNMIQGVTEGFEKSLEFQGVGYKANVKPARPDSSGHSNDGEELELNLGYSYPVFLKIPSGITVKIEKNTIKLSGINKELIGHFAAEIKSKRLPEPYKGSGIKYAGEIIRRKAGKKAATSV